ncbi:MAG: 30S ribosomal protein S20 [Candidatus Margulisiibacteriota bacterium]|nr:30S ribosomal protein S20 [Candidatus Margulisiibacteriota bacterium]
MANTKSSKKRILTSLRDQQKNHWYKARMKRLLKAAATSKDSIKIREAISLIDKAASKNVVSKNKASRKKSQLMRLVAA